MRKLSLYISIACSVLAATVSSAEQPPVPTYGSAIVNSIIQVHTGGMFRANINSLPPIVGENIYVVIEGIDPPEMWTPDPLSQAFGISARSFTTSMLLGAKKVELREIKRDSAFRLRADVYADGVNVAETLVKEGLAKPRVVDDKPRPGAPKWERMSLVSISEERARVLLRQITGSTELQVAMEVDCTTHKSRVAETKTILLGNMIAHLKFTEKERPFIASNNDEPIVTFACGRTTGALEGWGSLGEASGIEVLYHPSSITNSPAGGYRRVWLSYGPEAQEGMYYIEIDCSGLRRRTLDSYDKGGSEPRCPEPPREEPAWSHVPPGSVVDALIRKLCPQK